MQFLCGSIIVCQRRRRRRRRKREKYCTFFYSIQNRFHRGSFKRTLRYTLSSFDNWWKVKILLPEVTQWGVRSWGVDDVKRHLVIIMVWGAAWSAAAASDWWIIKRYRPSPMVLMKMLMLMIILMQMTMMVKNNDWQWRRSKLAPRSIICFLQAFHQNPWFPALM